MYTALLLSAMLGSAPPAANLQLHAREWRNNPPFQLHDTRDAIILFFKCDRENARLLTGLRDRLNQAHEREDLVVIALTDESVHKAERFMQRCGIQCTIGAESRSVRAWDIEEFPSLFFIERAGAKAREARSIPPDELSPAALDALLPPSPDAAAGQLRERIAHGEVGDGFHDSRIGAVARLYEAAAPDDFIAFADEQLPREPNPFVRARLEYYRDLAAGIERTDKQRSLSASAVLAFKENPQAERFAPVREFRTALPQLTVGDLIQRYDAAVGLQAADLLLRRKIVENLANRAETRVARQKAREKLLRIVFEEPDPSIRMIAAIELTEVADVGDAEAAEMLEAAAEYETNLWNTRPIMEYAARYLRTGGNDERK